MNILEIFEYVIYFAFFGGLLAIMLFGIFYYLTQWIKPGTDKDKLREELGANPLDRIFNMAKVIAACAFVAWVLSLAFRH